MKILCISDEIDPLIYSNSIKERFGGIDAVISAGDLRLTYYDFIVSSLNKPLYFLFGNHRLKGIESYSHRYRKDHYMVGYKRDDTPYVGATYIDNRVVKEKGILIAGLDGSIWYNGGKNQYTEIEMVIKVIRLIPKLVINKLLRKRFLDILVTHSPPYGFYKNKDRCHTGFKIFLWFMRTFKPQFLVHGHIHLYSINEKRTWAYDSTTVINAYNHCIIDI